MPHQRNRAWRRAQRTRFIDKRSTLSQIDLCIRPLLHLGQLSKTRPDLNRDRGEKTWSLIYGRSLKHKRAQKLGTIWPHPKRQMNTDLET